HALGPEAAVLAIITIVAHDEIVAGRHLPFALALHEKGHVVTFQDRVRAPGELLEQQVRAGGLGAAALADVAAAVHVPQRLAVDVHGVVAVRDGVARQPDHALYPV